MASAVFESLTHPYAMSDSSANADFLEDLFGQIDDQSDSTPASSQSSSIPDDEIFALLHSEKLVDEPKTNGPISLSLAAATSDDVPAEAEAHLLPGPSFVKQEPPESPPKNSEERLESTTDEVVFKRPFSPRSSPGVQEQARDEASSSHAEAPNPIPPLSSSRLRRFIHRLDPGHSQKCFLTGIKRKRPPSDTGELANMMKMLKGSGKLLIPDILLTDYLEEAGVEAPDSKVARLMGAAAEHHSACIVQDAMQVYLDGHQEKRRHGGKEPAGGPSEAGKVEKSPVKPKPVKLGRPASATSKGSGKSKGKGPKRKAREAGEASEDSSLETDLDKDLAPSTSAGLDSSVVDISALNDAADAEEDAGEKSITKSIVSKDEREGGGSKPKKDREKEAEKRHVLTLELLTPVLRDQGYHVGRPPYLVN